MESAGVILDDEEQQKEKKKASKPAAACNEEKSIDNLKKRLDEALHKEEYEKAAQIRDIINSKKNSDS